MRAFQRAGWEIERQHGSHIIMAHSESVFVLSLPLHGELQVGLLRDQIAKSGLSVQEFIDLLK